MGYRVLGYVKNRKRKITDYLLRSDEGTVFEVNIKDIPEMIEHYGMPRYANLHGKYFRSTHREFPIEDMGIHYYLYRD